MKSDLRPHDTSSGNLHPDGAIRCPFGFHSVITDESDRVEIRARAAVRGDQLAGLPLEQISRVFQTALSAAGVEFVQAEVLVYPPEHDCQALMDAERAGCDLWIFRVRDWKFIRRLRFATSQDRDRFVSAYLPVAPLLGGDGFFLCPAIPADLPEASRNRAASAEAHQAPDGTG
jgi:hypothetical protein